MDVAVSVDASLVVGAAAAGHMFFIHFRLLDSYRVDAALWVRGEAVVPIARFL